MLSLLDVGYLFLHFLLVLCTNFQLFYDYMVQLDEMLGKQGTKIDKVLNFAIDDAILEERITGRWIHPPSGRTYHTKFTPPKAPGLDDVSRLEFITASTLFSIAIRCWQVMLECGL